MPPAADTFSHYIFVDFENVPSVDLAAIAGQPAHVTLLLGEKQRRLELALVRQIHALGAQVTLIEVGASGRNALDLVLAAHLGRATLEHPTAEFAIISKDKDFDPLIAHLRARDVRVSRATEFAELPLLRPRKSASVGRTAAVKSAKPAQVSAARDPKATQPNSRFEKLVARLTSRAGPHPRTRERLLRHIAASFGQDVTDEQQSAVLDELVSRGIVTIDAEGKASYLHGRGTSPESGSGPN